MKTYIKRIAISSFNATLRACIIVSLFFTSIPFVAGGQGKGQSHHSHGVSREHRSHERHGDTREPHHFYRADSTRRMAELLEDLGWKFDEKLIERRQDSILASYVRRIKQPLDLRSKTILEAKAAYDLLLKGESQEAAQRFQHVKDTITENKGLLDANFLTIIRSYLAISYMRMGEQENCRYNHGAQSCLLPIEGSGVHKFQNGSRAAIKEYWEVLKADPGDLASRWLLNIAYMTVGEYPDRVPKEWLIPPEVFKSDYDIKRFHDVAPQLGLDSPGLAGGCIMEDFDGDSYIDIMVSSYGLDKERDQLRYFHNNGDGTFTDRTKEAGLLGLVGGINLCQADYNNDGYLDVLVLRGGGLGPLGHQPPSLLRNNGDGTFDDVTKEAGLLFFYPTQTAAWGDYDNDGWADLFIGTESDSSDMRMSHYPSFSLSTQGCKLFHNNGDGTFTDVSAEVGIRVLGGVRGAVWGDYNNDGLLDLYVSRSDGPNLLFQNKGKNVYGRWRFTEVGAKAGVTEPSNSFATWFWDYDNDGWLDIFVAGYSLKGNAYGAAQTAASYLGLPFVAETVRLYRNNRDGTFTNVTREVKLDKVLYTLGCNFGDLDNDGYLDLYVGTGGPDYRMLIPNRMFRNAEGKFFQDVTTSGGFGHLQKTHAIAFGDINNDGNQDVYAVIGGEYPGDTFQRALFLNPGHANHWIRLKLEGVRSNRAALGARIKVSVDTKNGSRDIYATVTSGGSFGASTLQQGIGLGQATAIRSIEITWPATGKVQIFKNIQMDQVLKIREGDPTPVPLKLKQISLSMDESPGKPADTPHSHKHHMHK